MATQALSLAWLAEFHFCQILVSGSFLGFTATGLLCLPQFNFCQFCFSAAIADYGTPLTCILPFLLLPRFPCQACPLRGQALAATTRSLLLLQRLTSTGLHLFCSMRPTLALRVLTLWACATSLTTTTFMPHTPSLLALSAKLLSSWLEYFSK